jgi:NAD+ kinase
LTSCFVHQVLDEQEEIDETHTPSIEAVNAEKKQDKDPEGNYSSQPTQSRLLTKRQLSEMALGIRELAKKLAHLQLKLRVKNIFILTKAHDQTLIRYTRELAGWLLEEDENHNV